MWPSTTTTITAPSNNINAYSALGGRNYGTFTTVDLESNQTVKGCAIALAKELAKRNDSCQFDEVIADLNKVKTDAQYAHVHYDGAFWSCIQRHNVNE